MFKNLFASLTQSRTKRQWIKFWAYVALVIALVALAFVTGSMLLKRAPYEFTAEQLTVNYLQNKTQIADFKVVPDLSGFVQQDVAYIGYYSDDGVIEENELASGVLVSESVDVHQTLLDQFKSTTPDCEYKQEKTRNQTEYLEALCSSSSFELYAFNTAKGGIIAFTSDVGSGKLDSILRNY